MRVNSRQPAATPSEVASINQLHEKPTISLDPKLRRALLRVLNRLEMEDKATIPVANDPELSDEDFLKIFGQPANTEDLGSLESKEDERPSERPYSNQDERPSERPYSNQEERPSERPYSNQDFNYIPNQPEKPEFSYYTTDPEQYLENQPTRPTPDMTGAVFHQLPTPIDIPAQVADQRPEVSTTFQPIVVPEERTKKEINETSVPVNISEPPREVNSTEKTPEKPIKHEVEFLPSSLIAAFTLQQDDRGNPKKVIPLDFDHNHPALVEKRQRELEQKEYLLQQQLRILQEEKYRVQGALNPRPSLPPPSPSPITNQVQTEVSFLDSKRQEELRQQEYLRQREPQTEKNPVDFRASQSFDFNQQQEVLREQELQRQQEFQRQQDLQRQQEVQRQQDIQRQQELQRQQEIQRQQEFQRQEALRFQRFQQFPNEQKNFIPNHRFQFRKPQEIDFQKSIDYRLPNEANRQFLRQPNFPFEHNRVNRHEPSNFIGNFGFRQQQQQQQQPLNTILAQTGLSQFLPSDTKDDLNIVSKVLSFGRLPGEIYNEPSRLIEPPKL